MGKKKREIPRIKGLYRKATKDGERWVLSGKTEDGEVKYVTVKLTGKESALEFAEAVRQARVELDMKIHPPKTLEYYIEQYAAKRNLSQGSIWQYHHALRGFSLDEKTNAERVSEILGRTDIKDTSKKRIVGIVNTFYKYLIGIGVMKVNPVAGVRIGRWERRTRIPTQDETMRFLLYTDTVGNDADSLFFRLVVLTGARVSSIQCLRCGDLTDDNLIHYYNVKTRKPYETPILLEDETSIALWHKLSDGRLPNQPLFGDDDEPLKTQRRLQCRMQRFFTDRDINNERLSPHSWRHAFGCALLNAGAPLATIASAMDHQSATVTYQYYSRPEQDAVNNAIRHANLLPDDVFDDEPCNHTPEPQKPVEAKKTASTSDVHEPIKTASLKRPFRRM